MDVIIEIDKTFDKEMKRMSPSVKELIERKINNQIELLKVGKRTPQLYKVNHAKISSHFDSSLYVLKINNDLRVMLTSESDPLFNAHVLTLLRIVKADDLSSEYKNIYESFNQSFLRRGDIDG